MSLNEDGNTACTNLPKKLTAENSKVALVFTSLRDVYVRFIRLFTSHINDIFHMKKRNDTKKCFN